MGGPHFLDNLPQACQVTWAARFQEWLYRGNPGRLAKLGSSFFQRIGPHRRRSPRIAPVDAPTIVVGGLSLGGAGKTPVTMFIAAHLRTFGRVAVVCRGWGGSAKGVRRVSGHTPEIDGDEATLMRRCLPMDVSVWAGRDLVDTRTHAAQFCDYVVVDDGYQTRALPATVDVVVMDATAPTRCLPAGPLREPLDALNHADFIWLNKTNEPGARPLPQPWTDCIESAYRVNEVVFGNGQVQPVSWLNGQCVRIWTGIGRPQSFVHALRAAGAIITDGMIGIDHRSPRLPGQDDVFANGVWLTTEKDWARGPIPAGAGVVRSTLEMTSGAGRFNAMLDVVVNS
ncbi:MAG: tetraacyldisaccharide 4'-kinase [Myxococcota bacterium]|nr:tetraacyldisaccharide 4'-kinase [Myxococcota bacterium]